MKTKELLLYASTDIPKNIMLRKMQVIRETIQFDTLHKVKRHKQNKVLLKDTSKCNKTQRKTRVVHLCLEEGGREKDAGEGNNQRPQKYCSVWFLQLGGGSMGIHNDMFSLQLTYTSYTCNKKLYLIKKIKEL